LVGSECQIRSTGRNGKEQQTGRGKHAGQPYLQSLVEREIGTWGRAIKAAGIMPD
jgi:hypothetical protein